MAHAQRVEKVRQLVAPWFEQLGGQGVAEPRESILIRGGIYCGRRFDAAKGYAIWFTDDDDISLYKSDGSVAGMIELSAADGLPYRAAA